MQICMRRIWDDGWTKENCLKACPWNIIHLYHICGCDNHTVTSSSIAIDSSNLSPSLLVVTLGLISVQICGLSAQGHGTSVLYEQEIQNSFMWSIYICWSLERTSTCGLTHLQMLFPPGKFSSQNRLLPARSECLCRPFSLVESACTDLDFITPVDLVAGLLASVNAALNQQGSAEPISTGSVLSNPIECPLWSTERGGVWCMYISMWNPKYIYSCCRYKQGLLYGHGLSKAKRGYFTNGLLE